MCASPLAVSTLFFLSLSLTLSSSRAAKSSRIQWRKPGESVKISCSSTSKKDQLYLRKVPDELLCLQSNLNDTETFAIELKARIKTKKTGPTELLITITNLTALDTGLYHCEFVVFKDAKPIRTIGEDEGSVLLVVHGTNTTKCVSPGDVDETFPVILVVVLCIVLLLLLGVLVSMWIIRKMKTMHVNAVRPPHRANPSDVYEDMRSTCRR